MLVAEALATLHTGAMPSVEYRVAQINPAMSQLDPPLGPVETQLAPTLEALLDAGLSLVSGCVVLSAFAGDASRAAELDQATDETNIEASSNHVHLEDHLAAPTAGELLAQAWAYVDRLASTLLAAHPTFEFRILVQYATTAELRRESHAHAVSFGWEDDGVEFPNECSVRFYRWRDEQGPWADNIAEMPFGAYLEIAVGPVSEAITTVDTVLDALHAGREERDQQILSSLLPRRL